MTLVTPTFFIIIFVLAFMVGVVMLIIGRINKNKKFLRRGFVLSGIPVIMILSIFLSNSLLTRYAVEANIVNLAGKFHISKIEGFEPDKSIDKNYTLELKKDSVFFLSSNSLIERICETGKYSFDYIHSDCGNDIENKNDLYLTLHCTDNFGRMSNYNDYNNIYIKRGLFSLELVFGSSKKIVFEKD